MVSLPRLRGSAALSAVVTKGQDFANHLLFLFSGLTNVRGWDIINEKKQAVAYATRSVSNRFTMFASFSLFCMPFSFSFFIFSGLTNAREWGIINVRTQPLCGCLVGTTDPQRGDFSLRRGTHLGFFIFSGLTNAGRWGIIVA